MTKDHGWDIDPGDDDYVAECDCKPGCTTYFCAGCKERRPLCKPREDDGLCEDCWQDEQTDKCGCRAPWCPCDGPKTGYMGE